jgi:zinc transport system substrate-binding protein
VRLHFIKSVLGLVAATVVVAVFAVGCREVEPAGVRAWVSIQPQKYFVERVGGDSVSVEVLVRPGQSPEMYAPSAAQMGQLARADLYFGIGVPIEVPLFRRIESSMRGVRIVHTGVSPVEYQPMEYQPVEQHRHGSGHACGGCEQLAQDPHIWLDPMQMISAVRRVRDALIEADPGQQAQFKANAAVLIGQLRDLDATLSRQLSPYAGRSFFINHPALGHFAARYGLEQRSIEHAGTAPSARRIADLVEEARAERAGAIFTQPEFGRTTASVLARALDVEVLELNILSEDYFVSMQQIADRLEKGFAR